MLHGASPARQSSLEAMDVDTPVFDPGANRPAQGDFLTVRQDNMRNPGKACQPPEQL